MSRWSTLKLVCALASVALPDTALAQRSFSGGRGGAHFSGGRSGGGHYGGGSQHYGGHYGGGHYGGPRHYGGVRVGVGVGVGYPGYGYGYGGRYYGSYVGVATITPALATSGVCTSCIPETRCAGARIGAADTGVGMVTLGFGSAVRGGPRRLTQVGFGSDRNGHGTANNGSGRPAIGRPPVDAAARGVWLGQRCRHGRR